MNSEECVIKVDNIKKKFKVYYDKGNSLKEKLLFQNRNRYENRWVLNGISFQIKKGEAVGLIGKNGCGKSTTLKMLSRIMFPTEGDIQINGRVSSLLELGAGFHPDMSGRENIYTNAAIFGLTRKEIEKRLSNIICFSELEEFIDNPVRTYSSGMYMRLAFSVAINVDADILLIDEILGVGDVSFQAKCFDKLKKIKANGTTIVIVSHSLGQIEKICERSLWIDNGMIRKEGHPKIVHDSYLETMEKERITKVEEDSQVVETEQKEKRKTTPDEYTIFMQSCPLGATRIGQQRVKFVEVDFSDLNGNKHDIFEFGDTFKLILKYKSDIGKTVGNIGFGIYRDDKVACFETNYYIEYGKLMKFDTSNIMEILIKNSNLLSGTYYLDIWIHDENAMMLDCIRNCKCFQITSIKGDVGVCRLQSDWKIGRGSI